MNQDPLIEINLNHPVKKVSDLRLPVADPAAK